MGAAKVLGTKELSARFALGFKIADVGTWFRRVAHDWPSDQPQEVYPLMEAVPYLKEWIGARKTKEPDVYKYTVVNKEFDSGISFHRNDVRRDKTGQVARAIQALGARTGFLPEDLLTALLVANPAAYDGTALYADRSALKTGGSINNQTTSAAATGTIPTVAEMSAAIAAGITVIYKATDFEGAPANQAVRRFEVMVPPAYAFAANGAIVNDYISSGVSNELAKMPISIGWFINPWLSAEDIFYTFASDAALMGLIFQEEKAVQMESKLEGSDYTIDTGRYSWHGSRIGNAAAGYPGSTVQHTFT